MKRSHSVGVIALTAVLNLLGIDGLEIVVRSLRLIEDARYDHCMANAGENDWQCEDLLRT